MFPGCEARPYLLFANKRDIRLFEVSPQRAATSSKTTVVVKQLEDAAALDFFLTDNRVCWSEIKLAVIKCSDVDPKKKGRVEKVNIILKQTYDKLQIALLTGTIIWDITKINPLCLLKRCIFSSFSSI